MKDTDLIKYHPGVATFSNACILFFFTGLICVCLPFTEYSCKDLKIICNNCGVTKATV
jgi:hypothetical protein